MITDEDIDESFEAMGMTVYPSLYAYSALTERYDETQLDRLVRTYYLDVPPPPPLLVQ